MPRAVMLSKQALHTLTQLHAELAGKIETNRKSGDKLRAQMVQVEAVMKMLETEINLRIIAPKRRVIGNPSSRLRSCRGWTYGLMMTGTLLPRRTVLRSSPGASRPLYPPFLRNGAGHAAQPEAQPCQPCARFNVHPKAVQERLDHSNIAITMDIYSLGRIDDHRRTLEGHSGRLLPFIKCEPMDKGNVRAFSRRGTITAFPTRRRRRNSLYECVARTIDKDLPVEGKYLEAYDTFRRGVTEIVDRPCGTVDLPFRFLRQNKGALLEWGREREFAELIDEEVAKIEASYGGAFPQ